MPTQTQTVPSVAIIAAQRSSIICDGQDVDNIVDEFGTDVIVRVVTKSFSGEYGDAIETYLDLKKRAVVQSYSANDDEVKEGVFIAGEIVFSFSLADEVYIVPCNQICYGGEWYQIDRVMKQPLVDVLYYLTARVQKI